jgi:hypothetical protein
VLKQFADATRHAPGPGNEAAGMARDGDLPGTKQKRDERYWPKPNRQIQF